MTAQASSLPRRRTSRPNRYLGQAHQVRPRAAKRQKARRYIFGFFRIIWRTTKLVFSGVFILVLLGGLSLGLVIGYRYLLNSDYLMVQKIILKGLNRVNRTEVITRIGLDKPSNMLALHLGEMAENVKSIPWVDYVAVTRKLPDTIIVDIKERRPRALINLGAIYYLDDGGRPFKKIDPNEKAELPIITGFTMADFTQRPKYTRRDLDQVFALFEVLTERNDCFRLENISEVNFDPVRGLSIFTRENNVQVKIGWGEYRAKMKRLGRVLAHLKIKGQGEDLVYFNLECGPRVIVRRAASS
ncbi:MAG: FtsQ-type POTRA domain-containing protein [Pseudomonadota bacterium]